MTPIAITMLVVSAALVWGGLIVSIVFLARRSEVEQYPAGGDDGADEDLDD